jgi:arylsulfatase A-like enzyme
MTHQFDDRIAALRTIDDTIGDIARAMPGAVIIFTSDNGWQYGQHRLGGKLDAYEESIGVPLIVNVGGGVIANQFITANDFTPTIMALAGGSMPYTGDGASFTPLLSNPTLPWRNRFLAEHWTAMTGSQALLFDMPNYLAVRTAAQSAAGDELYVEWGNWPNEAPTIEFYSYVNDPWAMNSLQNTIGPKVQNHAGIHKQEIQQLQNCGGGTCQTIEFQ